MSRAVASLPDIDPKPEFQNDFHCCRRGMADSESSSVCVAC